MPGLAFLGLAALLGLRAGTPLCLSRQLRMQGDYVLGGLFPLGSAEDADLSSRMQPTTTVCTRFSVLGLLWALAMKMAVEEINNATALLPGVQLGYDLFDTCSEPVVAMKHSLTFVAKAGSHTITAHCDYTQHQPRVLAVVGPHSSELALVTGKFFSFFLMPQVSYGASTDRLSNRELFPSFFRTVPSDRVQAVAIVELLQALSWNWVAAVGSDDEYGRQGLSLFSSLATSRGICIAHEGLVPRLGAGSQQLGAVAGVLQQVNRSSVQVVVLFSSARAAHTLFSYSIHGRLLPKVWVASEAWLTSDLVMTLPGMSQLLENMYNMSFRARGLALRFDTSGNVDMDYDLKLWVWRDLVPELRTVGTFSGRLQLWHSRMYWHTPGNKVSVGSPVHGHTAASLWPGASCGLTGGPGGHLRTWVGAHTLLSPGAPCQEPVSQCSRECEKGQVHRVKGLHSCCYDCVDCKAGSYLHSPDDLICTQCDQDQWSPDRSTRCFPRRPRFLAWGEPAMLVLLPLLGLALGLALVALGLFIQHRGSPLVQASGGLQACFGLVCLGLVCLSTVLFPGQPGPASCLAQQPLLHLPLTGCLSTLFLQAAEIFMQSELPPNWAGMLRGCLRGPRAWLAVLLAMLVEAALCAWYLVAFPPEVVIDWRALPTEALLHCRMHSWIGLGLVHAANASLAFLCFLGTFLVQSPPGHYSNAHGLTFAMLAYFITWTSFVPLFANVHVAYQPAVQMGAILLTALGILATFHLPKCYLLLWRPELNTPAFFLEGGPGNARGRGGSGGGEET
ncbi:taste receptor type 1 member 3 isoform X5 [Manis pentadactyla]|uniref:taste receptor type 1 member 3 isoform X5 n=1 Tax=Manis pentadactyla TaxID=143292 RepID=UPI00255CD4AC|nr:taste receptor type 1 member 3 isoform X5 [Manis pentadactyla]